MSTDAPASPSSPASAGSASASVALAASRAAILSLTVFGGFLQNQTIRFAEGLNAIVGGTGTGKSTILELIRFALGMEPVFGNVEEKKKYEGLVKSLGSGGVTVEFQTRHGLRYTATRSPGEPVRVKDAKGIPVDLAITDELFRVEFYAQMQVHRTAKDPVLLRNLLDKFTDGAAARATRELDDLRPRMEERSRELLRLRREIAIGAERSAALEASATALKKLQQVGGPDAETVRVALEHRALRARERAELVEAAAQHAASCRAVDELERELGRNMGGEFDAEVSAGPNRAVFFRYGAERREALDAMRAGVATIRAALAKESAAHRDAERALGEAQALQEERFTALIARHEEEKGRAAERTALEKRHVELLGIRRKTDALHAEYETRIVEWRGLVDRLWELRHGRSLARRDGYAKVGELLGGNVEASVLEHADREEYVSLLAKVLREKIRVDDHARDIGSRFHPRELVEIALADDVRRLPESESPTRAELARAGRILEAIRESERIFELECVDCPDRARLKLRTSDGGSESDDLTEGQGITCVLSLVCLHSPDPLLIDQPEDQIDGEFMYDVFVRAVRAAGRERQQIFVTHHPSIPMLGPAEMVIGMKRSSGRGMVAAAGPANRLGRTVERRLDGGAEAFVGRGRAYGYAMAREDGDEES